MNAIKNNPFLTALVVITVIVAGVLLFLISSASGELNQTLSDYEAKQLEYDGLTRAATYPSEENLAKLKDLRQKYAERVAELREELSTRQIEPQRLTTRGFQDLLIQQIEEAEAMAQENGVELPGDFGLGMAQYRTVLPPAEAVPELTVQLEVIDAVVTRMLQAPVTSINNIQRVTLPEEQGQPRNATRERRGRRDSSRNPRRNRDRQEEEVKILDRETFLVDFTANRQNVREVFNSMYGIEQMVTMQLASLRNEELTGPSKDQAAGGGAAGGAPRRIVPQDPDNPDAPLEEEALEPAAQFILGDEKVEGTIRFQIVSPTPEAVEKLEELL
jgi:hypothetical protein